MLYLSRKEGESIIINDLIELTVVEIKGRSVKLGFVFPPDAAILRKELYDKIKQQNIAATATIDATDLGEFTIDLNALPENKEKGDE